MNESEKNIISQSGKEDREKTESHHPTRRQRRAYLKDMKFFKSRKEMSVEDRQTFAESNREMGKKIFNENMEKTEEKVYKQLESHFERFEKQLQKSGINKSERDEILTVWSSRNMWPREKISREQTKRVKKLLKKIR